MFKNFDIGKIFDINRLFAGTTGPSFEYYREFIYIFSFFLLLSFSLWIYAIIKKPDIVTKKLLRRVRRLFAYFSLSGLLWLFFRWQKIYIFSSRAIFILIFIISLVWLGFIVKYYFSSYRRDLDRHKRKESIKKYIPKPKKR